LPSDLPYPRVDLLIYLLYVISILDLFILLFFSGDKPIASATSLTGRLKAAKYYFLDSTPCE